MKTKYIVRTIHVSAGSSKEFQKKLDMAMETMLEEEFIGIEHSTSMTYSAIIIFREEL